MGDGALSQDDIDDLLGGGFDDMMAPPEAASDEAGKEQALADSGSSPAASPADGVFDDLDSLIGGGDAAPSAQQAPAPSQKAPAQAAGSSSIDIQSQGNLPILVNVFLNLHVELGKKSLMIKDILVLGEGSIIELDKAAGEPVDILANSRALARGEVVVVDEQFGVRVTEMVDPLKID